MAGYYTYAKDEKPRETTVNGVVGTFYPEGTQTRFVTHDGVTLYWPAGADGAEQVGEYKKQKARNNLVTNPPKPATVPPMRPTHSTQFYNDTRNLPSPTQFYDDLPPPPGSTTGAYIPSNIKNGQFGGRTQGAYSPGSSTYSVDNRTDTAINKVTGYTPEGYKTGKDAASNRYNSGGGYVRREGMNLSNEFNVPGSQETSAGVFSHNIQSGGNQLYGAVSGYANNLTDGKWKGQWQSDNTWGEGQRTNAAKAYEGLRTSTPWKEGKGKVENFYGSATDLQNLSGRQLGNLEQESLLEGWAKKSLDGNNPYVDKMRSKSIRDIQQRAAARGAYNAGGTQQLEAESDVSWDAEQYKQMSDLLDRTNTAKISRLDAAGRMAGGASSEKLKQGEATQSLYSDLADDELKRSKTIYDAGYTAADANATARNALNVNMGLQDISRLTGAASALTSAATERRQGQESAFDVLGKGDKAKRDRLIDKWGIYKDVDKQTDADLDRAIKTGQDYDDKTFEVAKEGVKVLNDLDKLQLTLGQGQVQDASVADAGEISTIKAWTGLLGQIDAETREQFTSLLSIARDKTQANYIRQQLLQAAASGADVAELGRITLRIRTEMELANATNDALGTTGVQGVQGEAAIGSDAINAGANAGALFGQGQTAESKALLDFINSRPKPPETPKT